MIGTENGSVLVNGTENGSVLGVPRTNSLFGNTRKMEEGPPKSSFSRKQKGSVLAFKQALLDFKTKRYEDIKHFHIRKCC